MRRTIFTITFFLVYSVVCSQDRSDWILLNNGDTLRCMIWSRDNASLFHKPRISADTGDGRTLTYSSYDILAFQKGDTIFWSVPFKPSKKGKNKLVFAEVLMQNTGHRILKYENVMYTDYGPQYELKYYHYEGVSFKAEVTGGNYRKIIQSYFSDCPYIQELLAKKKNFFRDDKISAVAKAYRKNCAGAPD